MSAFECSRHTHGWMENPNVFPSQVYKRKTEAARKEYLKALAAYKANQLSQVQVNQPHFL